MSEQVQDDVVALAGRLLKAAKADRLSVTWFGGEPLLAPDIIASLSERLKAVAAERVVPEITASSFLRKHGLSAPSSVRTALPVLLDRDLLYRSESGYVVYDRLFADYLRAL